MSRHALHVVENAGTPATAGFVAVIIRIEGHGLVLWLKGHDVVVCGAFLVAGLHHHPELDVIGSLKPAQIPVQLFRIGDFPRLQAHAVYNIPVPGEAVSREGDLSRLTLDQPDFHHPIMDPLRRQYRPTGHIALFPVEVRDPVCHFAQVLQGDLFSDIGFRNRLDLLTCQNLRGIPNYLLQGKTDFRCCFLCGRSLPLFYFILFSGLILRNLFHDPFTFYRPAIPFHLGAGVHAFHLGTNSRRYYSSGCCRMTFRKQPNSERQTNRIGCFHHTSPIYRNIVSF